MIQKTDLIILLTYMQQDGVDVKDYVKKVSMSASIPIDALKFINEHRQFDVAAFYEKLRKNYNNKKSSLYINIVKEQIDPEEVVTILSSLLLQINLFGKRLDKSTQSLFYKCVRASEVAQVIKNYYTDYDVTEPIKLLRLIKCDLKVFESIK